MLPTDILEKAYRHASAELKQPVISDSDAVTQVQLACGNPLWRANSRILLACLLAKIDNPKIDIRKPYRQDGERAYSGRSYDERYISNFIEKYRLPCHLTSGFLSTVYRNGFAFTTDSKVSTRWPEQYMAVVQLFAKVEDETILAEDLLAEIVRVLLIYRTKWSQAEQWRNKLEKCRPGNKDFYVYENIGTEILEYLFSTSLKRVSRQESTNDGKQRRDLLFRNQRIGLFWNRVADRYKADFIIVDFKNYKDPIGPDVINDVQKYTNKALGNFVLVICRKGQNPSAFMGQLRAYRNHDQIILVVNDEQLIEMIQLKERNESSEEVLSGLLDQLLTSY